LEDTHSTIILLIGVLFFLPMEDPFAYWEVPNLEFSELKEYI
jgi:hypothetical protein